MPDESTDTHVGRVLWSHAPGQVRQALADLAATPAGLYRRVDVLAALTRSGLAGAHARRLLIRLEGVGVRRFPGQQIHLAVADTAPLFEELRSATKGTPLPVEHVKPKSPAGAE